MSSSLLGTTVGRYRIVGEIGKGGMGEVFAGYDEKLNRKVALKSIRAEHSLDTEAKERFLREARVLSQLEHPNICQIHDYVEGDEGDFLALELIDGRSLTKALRRGLSEKQRIRIAEQVAGVLVVAHEKGVVHRDLKPDNLMLTDDEQVKVLDFGLSRSLDDEVTAMLSTALGPAAAQPATSPTPDRDADDTHALSNGELPAPSTGSSSPASGSLTTHGTIMGTLGYMSPEQARGETATAASDLFSFGIILQELFTGKRAFEAGLEPAALLSKTQKGEVLPAEGLDTDLTTLINRMKALEPGARPSALDTAERLAWIREKPTRKRKKLLVGAAIGVLLVFSISMALLAAKAFRAEASARGEAERATEAEKKQRDEAEAAKQVSDFLVGMFEVSDPGEAEGNTVTARELLDKGAEKIDKELADQPLVRSRLMGTMGSVYRRLGLYPQSQELLELALAIREEELGPDQPGVAESLNDLAMLCVNRGKYDEAEPLFRRSLEIRERTLGPDHPDVAVILNNLGELCRNQSRNEEAESLYLRSLEIREKALGPDHPDVAMSLNNLAILRRVQGRDAEAETLLRRSLEIKQRALGPDHPDLALGLSNLANLVSDRGVYAEAQQLYERSLEIWERTLGPNHPDVAMGLGNLGELLLAQGKLDEAEPPILRCLAIREEVLGPDHRVVAYSLDGLAGLRRKQGKHEDANEHFARATSILEKMGDTYALPIILTNHADLLREMGRDGEAEKLEAWAEKIKNDR